MSGAADRRRPIAALADIPEGGLEFTFPHGPFSEGGILVRVGDGVRAWLSRCRHLAIPLDHHAPGEFLARDRRHLACGTPGALYRLADGLCVAGPCQGSSLRALPIAVRQGIVCLNIDLLPRPLAGFVAHP